MTQGQFDYIKKLDNSHRRIGNYVNSSDILGDNWESNWKDIPTARAAWCIDYLKDELECVRGYRHD